MFFGAGLNDLPLVEYFVPGTQFAQRTLFAWSFKVYGVCGNGVTDRAATITWSTLARFVVMTATRLGRLQPSAVRLGR